MDVADCLSSFKLTVTMMGKCEREFIRKNVAADKRSQTVTNLMANMKYTVSVVAMYRDGVEKTSETDLCKLHWCQEKACSLTQTDMSILVPTENCCN